MIHVFFNDVSFKKFLRENCQEMRIHLQIFGLFNFVFSNQQSICIKEEREIFGLHKNRYDEFSLNSFGNSIEQKTSALVSPAFAYRNIEHENVSNNIDPTLLSIIYIILFTLIYFIIDFLLWLISLLL